MDSNYSEMILHFNFCEKRLAGRDITCMNNAHPVYIHNLHDLVIAAAYHTYSIDMLIKYAGYPAIKESMTDNSECWIYEMFDTMEDRRSPGLRKFTVKDNMVISGGISIQDIEDMKQYLSDDDFNNLKPV
jgi:hypothetical protein